MWVLVKSFSEIKEDNVNAYSVIVERCNFVEEETSRNTKNVKIAVENANLCGKNMRYAHIAEIWGNRIFA